MFISCNERKRWLDRLLKFSILAIYAGVFDENTSTIVERNIHDGFLQMWKTSPVYDRVQMF